MTALLFVLAFIFFLWCLVSPFMPKSHKQTGIVIHNDIHIVNSPVNSNDHNEYREYKQLYYDSSNNKPRRY